ncbi:MAG: low molecular weight phosphotyrosine protein phosphatase [Clostridia bacterium]|nr:low molecular weight phosphotyrosine protein phosphatase [Clostridia bacterium]
MIKIMFVCHGNICRSPMAEFIFKDMAKAFDVHTESKAVSREEIGNPIYPPAAATLKRHGIPFGYHAARQITREDYDEFDYIIVMEQYNMPRLLSIIGNDDKNKVCRLLDFTDRPKDIEDPWYSGNFEMVYEEITAGCKALLKFMKDKGEI